MKRLLFLLPLALLSTSPSAHSQAPAAPAAPTRMMSPVQEPKDLPPVPPGITLLKNVVFTQTPQGPLSMLIAIPDAAKTKPLPVVMYVHGGGLLGGDRFACIHGMLNYAREGFVSASIDYRLIDHAPWPAQLEDCKAAVRFLRANAAKYGIDPERIGVQGDSAGGQLVALLGLTDHLPAFEGSGDNPGVSSRVQAVCDWFGPSDLMAIAHDPDPKYSQQIIHSKGTARVLGAPILQAEAMARALSPMTYVKDCPNPPPFLLVHGTKDPGIPVTQSFILADALEEKKADVSIRIAINQGHGGRWFAPKVMPDCIAFFKRVLKGEGEKK